MINTTALHVHHALTRLSWRNANLFIWRLFYCRRRRRCFKSLIFILYWELQPVLVHIIDVSLNCHKNSISHTDSHITLGQEPISGSEQLPRARITAFSRTSLFLQRFWRELWISFKFHKPVSKTYRPKNDIFCLLITFNFPFWYLILRIRS